MKSTMKKIAITLAVIGAVLVYGNSATATYSYTKLLDIIARINPETSEPRILARCSGAFMAAAASSQADPEAEETFTVAGQYALDAARDLGGARAAAELSDLGYRTMVDYLTRIGINENLGRTAIAREMDRCIPLLDKLPAPSQRI